MRYSVRYDGDTVLSTNDLEAAMACYRDDVLNRYAGYRKGGVYDNEAVGYGWIA